MYVFENERGEIKIGWSVRPHARLELIQAGNPFRVWVAHERSGPLPVVRRVEALAHQSFKARRIGKEWFNVPSDEAAAEIDRLVKITRLSDCHPRMIDFAKDRGNRRQVAFTLDLDQYQALCARAQVHIRPLPNLLAMMVREWLEAGGILRKDREYIDKKTPHIPDPATTLWGP